MRSGSMGQGKSSESMALDKKNKYLSDSKSDR